MKLSNANKNILICFSYLLVLSTLAAWKASHNSGQLQEHLKWVSPLFLEINFFLILIAVYVNLGAFKKITKDVTIKTWTIVILIILGSILVIVVLAPRIHRIYYDEDIYLNIAQNMANMRQTGMCNEGEQSHGKYFCKRLEYNKEPNGWPYLISLIFRSLGSSHTAGFLMNNFIWGVSILVVFFTGFLLFKDEKSGIFASLIFALLPEGLRWSNTIAAEPSAALFTGLGILSVIFFTRKPGMRSLFLVSVLIPFAFQFRPESILIVISANLAIILLAPEELEKKTTFAFILLIIVMASPHFIHLSTVKGYGWGAPGGSKFALKFLEKNITDNTLFYLKNDRFPILFTILFFMGLGLPMKKIKKKAENLKPFLESFFWKEKCILLSWFLAFWGIFLFFYAGSYNFGVDVRFSLISFMPFSVLAGFGACALGKWGKKRLCFKWTNHILTLFIIISFLTFIPYIKTIDDEAWSARADHKYAEVMSEKLPDDSLVLTHNPNMFLLWGKNAAQASIATDHPNYFKQLFNRYAGGIYFHYNYWCNTGNPLQVSFCKNILTRYQTTRVVSFKERHHEYVLYKLHPDDE